MNKDCGIPLTKLLVDGGMTVNSYIMQLQADLCGIPVGLYLHVLQHILDKIISKSWKLHVFWYVCIIAKSNYLVRHVCSFFHPSAWNNWAPSACIFIKFDSWIFFENLSRKFKRHWNLTRITGTLCEDQYTLLIIPRSVLLSVRNVSDIRCRENWNILCSVTFEKCAVYEIMWQNIVEPDRP